MASNLHVWVEKAQFNGCEFPQLLYEKMTASIKERMPRDREDYAEDQEIS